MSWVGHNDLRSATHAAANVRLVDFHTPLPLAQAWGGGEMASVDAMCFVIPVATINAAYNPPLLRPATWLHAVFMDGRHLHPSSRTN